jgi:hypothetical protein
LSALLLEATTTELQRMEIKEKTSKRKTPVLEGFAKGHECMAKRTFI